MASGLARAVSSLQNRLSMDANRDKSPRFPDTTLTRDQGSGGLPTSTSFSDFSMSVGDEVANMYETSADDFGNGIIKETLRGTQSAFVEPTGQTTPFGYSANTDRLAAKDYMQHAHSLPPDCLQKPHRREGSEHSQSNPVAIPTSTMESLAACDLEDDDSRAALSAPLPLLSRSFFSMITTPKSARRKSMSKDAALEYFEFADVMRSF